MGSETSPSQQNSTNLNAQPGNSETTARYCGMTHGDALVVFGLALLLLGLAGGRFVWHGVWGNPLVHVETLQGEPIPLKIDINSANWIEFLQLDGIGETLARRIVADRDERGPFQSVDDLVRVRGLGEKMIERFRPYLTCEPRPKSSVNDP
ncbi:Helix-hairpin-helix DNA-binding class 1 [Planctopirus limnophila DSM 3776]|uniref:Helix-hairpin-helix DNA-binding class 1 n=1 Tax=Planctopirus limnophila (strain ATCC 43296 / DSM 3776 / IFAM 1008 / Mu 290) TaxID=521674 RepID=D5SS65_PLAL2|nr:helix-hairpin-helix domain-containing protein [Planctopirus limnophila]ADG68789.1 Helix-hairpin-helix DNA-binding class 1 [Planctopirus limnophila DSM 3776]